MAKDDYVKFKGIVTDVLPGNKYRVLLENEHTVLAYLGGKMKQFRIFPCYFKILSYFYTFIH